jgi:hypothetical protein
MRLRNSVSSEDWKSADPIATPPTWPIIVKPDQFSFAGDVPGINTSLCHGIVDQNPSLRPSVTLDGHMRRELHVFA